MKTKREIEIDLTQKYLADLKSGIATINPDDYFDLRTIDFDDEKPKIMTVDDVFNRYIKILELFRH